MTHPHSKKHVVPTAVLTRSRLVPFNDVRPVTTVVPQTHVKHQRPVTHGNPQQALKDKGFIDSGCSRHMIGNISYLSEFEEINGGYVAFGRNPKGELKFNLFSVSQMCDKKNNVLFTDTECVVLSFDFKLPDENHVLFKVPRENNMYNVDQKNIVPLRDLTCLFEKATLDESNLYRRLGHINFKTMNKLVKGNLVRGLPSKVFKNNHTCVACKKGKQHRASSKTKPVSSVSQPLQRLHIDLFGPTFVKSLNKKSYCLVVTDDYSKFSWVFFLATKDETSTILKTFITGIENQINHKVKIIRSDNRNEFNNQELNQFCGMKRIKREFSVARTSQQNGVAERKNRTLIEAARTMIAYSLLPIPFWAKAVNTACYVQNRVLVTKPHNKTPYELLLVGGKSSFVDPSQYPDDPNMPALEDIIYSDDEEDVSTEADFSNLETIKQKDNGIFITQDKYVAKILRKFGLTDDKSTSTPIDTEKPLLKDPDDIMFAVCACARLKVTPKVSHFHAVKRIFRYLKGKLHLGLWYPKDSPFNLVAYSDSDYAGASLDRKSTIGGCQFLGCRLISWQCKKQTIIVTSSTEAEYVATASCCA
nr:putative ribonuclease H-like domain-containing protein [Tanacetum cinerariifolium]